MAFGKMARATSSKAKKELVATEMTKQTGHCIKADMVEKIPNDNMYIANYGNVTILCWVRDNGNYVVKKVCW